MKNYWLAATLFASVPSAAYAAPGLDDVAYGATVEAGKSEIETRYGRLTGGPSDGEDALVIEASHTFTSRFYGRPSRGLSESRATATALKPLLWRELHPWPHQGARSRYRRLRGGRTWPPWGRQSRNQTLA